MMLTAHSQLDSEIQGVAMTSDVELMKDLTDSERLLLQTELAGRRKDGTVGVLLSFFLGGLGAHRFYMGQVGLSVLYAVFCWTLVPAIVAIIECFLMPGRVRAHNDAVASEIALKLKALRV